MLLPLSLSGHWAGCSHKCPVESEMTAQRQAKLEIRQLVLINCHGCGFQIFFVSKFFSYENIHTILLMLALGIKSELLISLGKV